MANEYLNKYSLNHRGEMILYNETNNISCCWNFYNQENNMTDHLYLSNGLASNYWVTTENSKWIFNAIAKQSKGLYCENMKERDHTPPSWT